MRCMSVVVCVCNMKACFVCICAFRCIFVCLRDFNNKQGKAMTQHNQIVSLMEFMLRSTVQFIA